MRVVGRIIGPMRPMGLMGLMLLLLPVPAAAQQTEASWQDVWQELTAADDDFADERETDWDDAYSLLEQMAAHPIDINRCTADELRLLPFLSDRQVADLLDYRNRYGAIRSAGELPMVASLAQPQTLLLPFFIVFGPQTTDSVARSLPDRHTRLSQELTAGMRVPFYRRQGDHDGYAGPPLRHHLRYELSLGRQLHIGIMGAQDAGEPFFTGINRWGYDYYTFFAQLHTKHLFDNVVLGRYKLAAAQGLVLGGGAFTGKTAQLLAQGRNATRLRPHTSRSEADYLQGAAATMHLGSWARLTPFVSLRRYDATLAADGSVQTLVASGYHRTDSETARKHNTLMADAGLRAEARGNHFNGGLTAVYSRLDRALEPATSQLYRRYLPQGRQFVNVSADYGFHSRSISLNGETATDAHGHLATLNTLSLQPSEHWTLTASQRYYSYRYQSLHARAMSEGSRVQNESAVLLAVQWRPGRRWLLQAFADYARFPWARYLVSLPSEAVDMQLQATRQTRRWTLGARYRWHRRERDNETKTALEPLTDHRVRLTAQWHPRRSPWLLTTRADFAHTTHLKASTGCLVSQSVQWQRRPLLVSLLTAWFHTDDYASRLYVYERQLPHEFGFNACSGHGMRLSALARAAMGRWLLHGRLALTRYFDRTAIGTGLQQTPHRGLLDLDLQLSYSW